VLPLPTEPTKGDRSHLWFKQALHHCLCCPSMCTHIKCHLSAFKPTGTVRILPHRLHVSGYVSLAPCGPIQHVLPHCEKFWLVSMPHAQSCQQYSPPHLCSQHLPPIAPPTPWASDNYFQITLAPRIYFTEYSGYDTFSSPSVCSFWFGFLYSVMSCYPSWVE
jgi:hypothetical protein